MGRRRVDGFRSRRVRVGAVALAVVLLAAGCSSGGDDGADPDPTTASLGLVPADVLRLGIAAEQFQFDPAEVVPTDQGQLMTVDLLYDGLTAIDPETADAVPALAASWESEDDFTRWVFTLRDDATFSDGSSVTGEDVKASIERLAGRGSSSLAGVRLDVIDGYGEFVAKEVDEITGISVSDDGGQLIIETTEAYAPLPELVATPLLGVLPAGGDVVEGALVTSGPLLLAGDAADEAARELAASSAEDVVVLDPAPGAKLGIAGVELVRFEDIETSYTAFTSGSLDWSLVPSAQAEVAAEVYGADAMTPFHAEFFYGINVAQPAYEDRDFREAIVRAINREKITAELFPNGSPLNGTVVRGVPGFKGDPCGVHCRFAPGRSIALIEKAFPDGDVPTVTLDLYEGEREQALTEAVAAGLEHVGIPTELRVVEDDYETFVTSGDQEVFLFGWVGLAPTADSYLAPLFLSGSPDNVTAFSSDPVNLGIAAARSLEDADERVAAYQEVERLVMAQVPVIPMVQVKTLAVVSSAVSGWEPRLGGTFVVERVRLGE